MTTEDQCPLPFPKRFHAAVDFVASPHPNAKSIPEDLSLRLESLRKQAIEGPCQEPRPWSWNVRETTKWESWNQLGTMSKTEAMQLFVNQLERTQPDWWRVLSKDGGEGVFQDKDLIKDIAELTEEQSRKERVRSLVAKVEETTSSGSWSTPYLTGTEKPLARYDHGMILLDDQMYIIGGNCSGRYLNDIWRFDFATFSWMNLTPVDQDDDYLPPIAGHSVVYWKGYLLIVGGHVKLRNFVEKMPIRSLDLESMEWGVLEVTGEAPVSRGGHCTTLLGDKIYIFGGEDAARRPLSDLHVLDLETCVWSKLNPSQTHLPSPRSAHSGTTYLDRYLLYFGGGSVASCFDDLVVFDTQEKKWHVPVVIGRKPSPRAGHSSAVIGDRWYIVGGGNNASGCTDMAYLDLTQMRIWPPLIEHPTAEDDEGNSQGPGLDDVEYEISWTIVGTVPEKSYLASEGMSLGSIKEAGVLVAFGGYNGRYSNAVSLFRPKEDPPPITQLSFGSEISGLENANEGTSGSSENRVEALQAKLEAVMKNASAAKEASVYELGIMHRQLNSAHGMLQERDTQVLKLEQKVKELDAKASELEAELEKAKDKLGKMEEMEKELEVVRQQKQQVSSKKTGGIWGWAIGE